MFLAVMILVCFLSQFLWGELGKNACDVVLFWISPWLEHIFVQKHPYLFVRQGALKISGKKHVQLTFLFRS
jgi:hypothetical protein